MKTIKFSEIAENLNAGRRVYNSDWKKKGYLYMASEVKNGTKLSRLHKQDDNGLTKPYMSNNEDVLSKGWYIA